MTTRNTETEVNAALAELRQLFPVPPLRIVQVTEWTIAGRRVRWNIEINQFCISSLFGDIDDPGQPATLERCMIAVREWAKARANRDQEQS
jgi:hypothetical protein